MNDTLPMRIGLVALILPLLFVAANGVGMLLGSGDFDSRQEQILYGFVAAMASLAAAAGLWLCARQPRLGLGLLIGGIVVVCALFYWMLLITVPIGLTMVVFGVWRSGIEVWPFRGPRPSATGGS